MNREAMNPMTVKILDLPRNSIGRQLVSPQPERKQRKPSGRLAEFVS
jgi:hypothetical protein